MPQSATPPSSSGPSPRPEPGGATLSRELADFLVELSIAMHKHAIYPAGHPLLDASVDSVARRLTALLADRPTLSIGIARKQLVIEGVATDSGHPLLQELAQKLHRHHLGALRFTRGVDRRELGEALATLAVDVSRMEKPLGLETEAFAQRWANVRLFPLTYDRLELIEEDAGPAEDRMQAGRAAQLWVGLARAALAAEAGEHPNDDALEPVAVARAIEEHKREQAYDQVIVGYMLQIANELKANENAETTALQRRISKLVGELSPDTLRRLLNMSGDTRQRRRFVLDATQGMTVDAVVELVQAAADAEQQTISHSLVRMLTKLAQHAQQDTPARRTEADRSLREAVGRLVSSWSLDDPNPSAYRAVLEKVSRAQPAQPMEFAETECEPDRLVQIALESGVLGAQIRRAADRMIAQGRLVELLDLLDTAPHPSVAEELWTHLRERETLRELLSAERVDFPLVRRLVKRWGMAATSPLVDAAEAAGEARQRERLYEELAQLGDSIGPVIARRLPGAPPYIQRELLALLGRLSLVPAELDTGALLAHGDPAVRRESVRLLLRQASTREATLLSALADDDERTVNLALHAALEGCPRAGVDLLRERVDRGELDSALRAAAIRVVATLHTPETVQWLLARVVTRGSWFRRLKALPKSPEQAAALHALATTYRSDPAVAEVLKLL